MSSGPSPRSTRRRPRPHRSTRPVALAAALILGLTAIACSSDGPDEPSATVPTVPTTKAGTTTDPEATTTTAAPTVEEQVEAAYLEAQAALGAAARTANASDPRLAETRTGPSLEKAQESLRALAAQGLVVRYRGDGPPVPELTDVELSSADVANVTACVVDDAQRIRVEDDRVTDDLVESRLDRAELRRADGTWKLYSLTALDRWQDGLGCDR